MELNETHDPSRRSWITAANNDATDFPIQNLPFGIFRHDAHDQFRGGVAIGDRVLDLRGLSATGLLSGAAQDAAQAAAQPSLNAFMRLGRAHWSALRLQLSRLLGDGRNGRDARATIAPLLMPMDAAELTLPAVIGDYTDFYAGIHHATAVGRLFRPENPLLPNYKWLPIAYHGRASSILASRAGVRRPNGQHRGPNNSAPQFGPTRRLDFELELGIFLGAGNAPGETISIEDAREHIFGYCLLNDWSARDIQAWEYQPLGPFLAKNFATTISPWIVTAEALAPYAVPAFARPADDPKPLPYLSSIQEMHNGGFDIQLDALIATPRSTTPHRLARSNSQFLYWTPAQMVTHHASNGCRLNPGDLLGTGTISGPDEDAAGSLLELTDGGKEPIRLPSGETRSFLEDGDTIVLRGHCHKAGFASIGFGDCAGTIIPARA